MTTNQASATAAGAVPAARIPPDAGAATLPGRPFPLGATPGEYAGLAGLHRRPRSGSHGPATRYP